LVRALKNNNPVNNRNLVLSIAALARRFPLPLQALSFQGAFIIEIVKESAVYDLVA